MQCRCYVQAGHSMQPVYAKEFAYTGCQGNAPSYISVIYSAKKLISNGSTRKLGKCNF